MSKSLRIQKRRRRENKTDYGARLQMLKSYVPRLVIRRTNKYIIIQLVSTEEAKDKVLSGVTSKELLENGWDTKLAGSLKSLPAAYLTGILMAKKLGKAKEKYAVDLGMARNIKGSRIYASVKGLVDGGLNVSAGEKCFPTKERIEGNHTPNSKAIVAKVKAKLLGSQDLTVKEKLMK